MRDKITSIIMITVLVIAMALTGCEKKQKDTNGEIEVTPIITPETEDVEFKIFETADVCVQNMKLGWNVGNSLDSTGAWINPDRPYNFETAWGNPVTGPKLIKAVKASGFNAVRVPVTWMEKMDENGNLNEEWLARVKEVVDLVIAEDMYCIINVHHDTGGGDEAWIRADKEMYDNGMSERYAFLWKQIAEYFKDYDGRLLFESLNETLDANSNWGGSTAENYEVVNMLNQLFVDTVRATGGNNSERNIIVLTYGASSAASQVGGFIVPQDTANNHLIAEVHIYDPSGFCNGNDETWDEEDRQVLETIFERLNKEIIEAQGVPMIIGEFGSHDNFGTEEYATERAEYASDFVSIAKKYGITCFWWDDGGPMKIFERIRGEVVCQQVVDAMVAAVSGE